MSDKPKPGMKFHLLEGKATFILQRALHFEILKIYGKLRGTKAKTGGNKGHGLCLMQGQHLQ